MENHQYVVDISINHRDFPWFSPKPPWLPRFSRLGEAAAQDRLPALGAVGSSDGFAARGTCRAVPRARHGARGRVVKFTKTMGFLSQMLLVWEFDLHLGHLEGQCW